MQRTPEIFEKIEQYLTNRLSPEDLIAFKKEIHTNPQLQEEIEKHRVLHKILEDQDTLIFKEKLAQISSTIKQQDTTSQKKSTFFSFWKIAASIAILIGIGISLWYTSNTINQTQGLYKAYYVPFPSEDTIRGEITEEQGILKNYTKGAYEAVITTLEKHPNLMNQQRLRLYLGNSYLNTNQEEKAIKQFIAIRNKDRYYEIAQWYLSLTYLKMNDSKKTKTLLKNIINYDGVYKDKASQLLKALVE
ncbi:tetratricopeptide repeat protein [Aquimarina longa]|uniref:tetratricopeptide repeat protein n=1 Tax=Aquimarina longa TaxID=1080221 RepID=UPI0007804688|nr:hypothetical protein [Aquimarina longa]